MLFHIAYLSAFKSSGKLSFKLLKEKKNKKAARLDIEDKLHLHKLIWFKGVILSGY